jgi:Xaa-Pro dipeptidase
VPDTFPIVTADRQRPFDEAEFARRLERVQTAMTAHDLDALLVTDPSNVYYLTGYQTFGNAQQFLVVPRTGTPVFVLRELESPLVRYTTWLSDVISFADSEPLLDALKRACRARDAFRRVGLDYASMPVSLYQAIVAEFTQWSVVDGQGILDRCRAVKSPAEHALCREAARLTDIGMAAAIEASVAGADENTVAAAAGEAMVSAGSEWFANDPIVTAGRRSAIPHTTFCRHPLANGDPVILEMSASYFRYFGPLMRSVAVGHAPEQVQEFHTTCELALAAALDTLRPGVTSDHVHMAAQRVIDERGHTGYFRKRLGYSVGIGMSSWNEGRIFDLKAGDRRPIEAGMVFHMPPALRLPGGFGVGVSETAIVTEAGCEPLSKLPRTLTVRG